MDTPTQFIDIYTNKFIGIAESHNVTYYFDDYKILGDGSLISQEIDDYMIDAPYKYYSIKMKPSEQILEITFQQ